MMIRPPSIPPYPPWPTPNPTPNPTRAPTVALPVCSQEGYKIAMGAGWEHYPIYKYGRTANVARTEGLCLVTGLVQTTSWVLTIGQLPHQCRPSKRLIFNQRVDGASIRVDIKPDGQIVQLRGTIKVPNNWLSLAGIVFPLPLNTKKTLYREPLFLAKGWGPYKDPQYGHTVTATKEGALCVMDGLLQTDTWEELIGTMPLGCMPTARMVFHPRVKQGAARVDILPNGEVLLVSGRPSSGNWLSMSGLYFTLNQNKFIEAEGLRMRKTKRLKARKEKKAKEVQAKETSKKKEEEICNKKEKKKGKRQREVARKKVLMKGDEEQAKEKAQKRTDYEKSIKEMAEKKLHDEETDMKNEAKLKFRSATRKRAEAANKRFAMREKARKDKRKEKVTKKQKIEQAEKAQVKKAERLGKAVVAAKARKKEQATEKEKVEKEEKAHMKDVEHQKMQAAEYEAIEGEAAQKAWKVKELHHKDTTERRQKMEDKRREKQRKKDHSRDEKLHKKEVHDKAEHRTDACGCKLKVQGWCSSEHPGRCKQGSHTTRHEATQCKQRHGARSGVVKQEQNPQEEHRIEKNQKAKVSEIEGKNELSNPAPGPADSGYGGYSGSEGYGQEEHRPSLPHATIQPESKPPDGMHPASRIARADRRAPKMLLQLQQHVSQCVQARSAGACKP